MATASAVDMKKTLLTILSLACLASCGTPTIEKNIVKNEGGTVHTKYFSITLPQQWRVASSLTSEVRDGYYPKRFKAYQRFMAYDPTIFEKTLEIGIYEKFVPSFAEYAKNIEETISGDKITKTEVTIDGLKFTKYACYVGTTEKRPTTYIAQKDDFYIHIFTQNTWKDLEKTIETLVFTKPEEWKEGDVSQAETDDLSFSIIGNICDTYILKCTLPDGWKIKTENESGIIFSKSEGDSQDIVNCFINRNSNIDQATKSVSRTMSNPKIENIKYGNTDYVKVFDPTDGTTKSIYFAKKGDSIVSFFCSSPTQEPSKDRIAIFSSLTLK